VAFVIYLWLDDPFEFQDDETLSSSLKNFLVNVKNRTLTIEKCEKKLANIISAASAMVKSSLV
jgi:hypothetical protein